MPSKEELARFASGTTYSPQKEGWLKKKSHHLGDWRSRYFTLDEDDVLRYWKWPVPLGGTTERPRGEIPLAGCHAFAVDEGEDRRLVVRTRHHRFDEEFEAKNSQERDDWVRELNGAALRQRGSMQGTEKAVDFMMAKGLWENLLDSVVWPAEAALSSTNPGNDGCGGAGPSGACAVSKAPQIVCAHTKLSRALLRLPLRDGEMPTIPTARQGKLVRAGRRVLRYAGLRSETAASLVGSRQWSSGQREGHSLAGDLADAAAAAARSMECWLFLVSSRRLEHEEPNSRSRSTSYHRRKHAPKLSADEADRQTGPVIEFETLHVFADPTDAEGPFASLPLCDLNLDSATGSLQPSIDGSGFEMDVGEGAGAWTFVFPTMSECEQWRRALQVARWSALAREAGRRRTPEEALVSFERDQEYFRQAMAARLEAVSGDVTPLPQAVAVALPQKMASSRSAPAVPAGSVVTTAAAQDMARMPGSALQRVLCACEDVFCEAEEVLDAALRRPSGNKSETYEAIADFALGPVLDCLGRFWMRWNAMLSQSDCRTLLRWLDQRLSEMSRLGVVYEPLRDVVVSLASELCLRAGVHLQRMARQLLVHALKVDEGVGRQQPVASAGISNMVSMLPIDLFTMVYSCLPQGPTFDDAMVLRESSQRVAKFVVWDTQQVLWQWTLATHEEVLTRKRARGLARGTSGVDPAGGSVGSSAPSRAAPLGGEEEALPRRSARWLEIVGSLVVGMPAFVDQCQDLSRAPLCVRQPDDVCPPAAFGEADALKPEALPSEWSLDTEAARFEALQEALLWALSDVATAQWRRQVIGNSGVGAPTVGPSSAGVGGVAGACATLGPRVSIAFASIGLSGSLKTMVAPSLRLLLKVLEPRLFEALLLKVFSICFSTYIIRVLNQEASAPAPRSSGMAHVDAQLALRREDLQRFCEFFKEFANAVDSGGFREHPWEVEEVVRLLRETLTFQHGLGQVPQWLLRRPSLSNKHDLKMVFDLLRAKPCAPLPLREALQPKEAALLSSGPEELPPVCPLGGTYVSYPQAPSSSSSSSTRGGPGAAASRKGPFGFFGAVPGTAAMKSTPRQQTQPQRQQQHGPVELFGRPRCQTAPAAPVSATAAGGVEHHVSSALRWHTVSLYGDGSDLPLEAAGAYLVLCSVRIDDGAELQDLYPEEFGSGGGAGNELWLIGGEGGAVARLPSRRRSSALSLDSLCSASALDAPNVFGASDSAFPVRRRWAQLARTTPDAAAVLEMFSARPSPASEPLEAVQLTSLYCVSMRGAAELSLVFDVGSDASAALRRYTFCFDCPSHALRWCHLLEAWWLEGVPPPWAPRSVIALRSSSRRNSDGLAASSPRSSPQWRCRLSVDRTAAMASPANNAACNGLWGSLPAARLSRDTLERRLGRLWQEVQRGLAAPASART